MATKATRCFNENALKPFVKAKEALTGRVWTREQADELKRIIDTAVIGRRG